MEATLPSGTLTCWQALW
jgi:hypothetical protein